MKNRITIGMLCNNAAMLNRMTNAPTEPYSRDEQGRLRANIGNYHISQAYGGYSLHLMCNESGGINDVFNCGHIPARELHNRIWAYARGLEAVGDDTYDEYGVNTKNSFNTAPTITQAA